MRTSLDHLEEGHELEEAKQLHQPNEPEEAVEARRRAAARAEDETERERRDEVEEEEAAHVVDRDEPMVGHEVAVPEVPRVERDAQVGDEEAVEDEVDDVERLRVPVRQSVSATRITSRGD